MRSLQINRAISLLVVIIIIIILVWSEITSVREIGGIYAPSTPTIGLIQLVPSTRSPHNHESKIRAVENLVLLSALMIFSRSCTRASGFLKGKSNLAINHRGIGNCTTNGSRKVVTYPPEGLRSGCQPAFYYFSSVARWQLHFEWALGPVLIQWHIRLQRWPRKTGDKYLTEFHDLAEKPCCSSHSNKIVFPAFLKLQYLDIF